MTSPSSAQSDAARCNGALSHGPVTEAGRARSAQNARRHGLRAGEPDRATGTDQGHLASLEQSVAERFIPADPLEEAICRRIALALWRLERIDRLEAAFWERDEAAEENGTNEPGPGLDTILRYQTAAANALSRALRDLEKLRSGRLDHGICTNEPGTDPGPMARPLPRLPDLPDLPTLMERMGLARRDRAICTNEPEAPPPRPAGPSPVLNRHQRRRLAALGM